MNTKAMSFGIACAVLACGSALAQPAAQESRPVARVVRLAPVTLNGKAYVPSVLPEANQTVYDNSEDPLFYGSGIDWALDDMRFTSVPANLYPGDPQLGNDGPGAGGNIRINAIQVGFVVDEDNTATPNLDVLVQLWDRCELLGTTSPVNSDLLGQLRVGFTVAPQIPGTGFVSDDWIDITSIFPGGLLMPDDEFGLVYRMLIAGTNTDATAYDVSFAGSAATLNPVPQGPKVGGSADVFFQDANLNGQFDSDEDYWFFGTPNHANFYFKMRADIGTSPACCVDFNNDTEVDFSDVEGFLGALGAMIPGTCAPGADFNNDTEFDFSDIEAFIGVFNAALGTICTP